MGSGGHRGSPPSGPNPKAMSPEGDSKMNPALSRFSQKAGALHSLQSWGFLCNLIAVTTLKCQNHQV